MEQRSFIINNKLGLHARAAALFVNAANKFKSQIFVLKDGIKVNGKSIMGLLTLAAAKGTEIIIITEGNDAPQAIKFLGEIIENKFGEE